MLEHVRRHIGRGGETFDIDRGQRCPHSGVTGRMRVDKFRIDRIPTDQQREQRGHEERIGTRTHGHVQIGLRRGFAATRINDD